MRHGRSSGFRIEIDGYGNASNGVAGSWLLEPVERFFTLN